MKVEKQECCPKFNPEKWSEKTFNWDQEKFIKATVPTFFHIPLPPMIGKRVTKMMKLAEDSKNLSSNKEDILLLFTDPHAFMSEIYLSVTNDVPNANNTTLSGNYISKVFDGAYNDIPKFINQMDAYLKKQKEKAEKYYVHYAYCPKCAKETGHNYMVLFAQLEK
ncbi:hydrolase [Eudoraea sp.]|uniref:hydrolase n=1 Tax=Eudoraea sp. TaxID=1979955 RepID=UPI003C786B3A